MRKLVKLFLLLSLLLGLTACGHTPPVRTVGIAMPTQYAQRWLNDGANMKQQLENKGYQVLLEYAGDDIDLQVQQLQSMLDAGVDCLVIASIDSTALLDVQAQAQAAGIPVIAYDRLLMQSQDVSYYATFDNEGVGRIIGEYIVAAKELDNADEAQTIEFFMGSPDDNNAVMLHRGLMKVLRPYLDSGVLVCRSGRTSFEDTCILRWSQQTAQERCTELLSGLYAGERPDILCSAYDSFSYGCRTALEEAGFQPGPDWPLITGQDADVAAIRNRCRAPRCRTRSPSPPAGRPPPCHTPA